MPVKEDHFKFRPLTYNLWHRTLNHQLYGMDVDFIEGNKAGKVVAITELKLAVGTINLDDYNTGLLVDLARERALFCVVYYPFVNGKLITDGYRTILPEELEFIQFYVIPVTDSAREWIKKPQRMLADDYEKFLLSLRTGVKITWFDDKKWRPVRLPTVEYRTLTRKIKQF